MPAADSLNLGDSGEGRIATGLCGETLWWMLSPVALAIAELLDILTMKTGLVPRNPTTLLSRK